MRRWQEAEGRGAGPGTGGGGVLNHSAPTPSLSVAVAAGGAWRESGPAQTPFYSQTSFSTWSLSHGKQLRENRTANRDQYRDSTVSWKTHNL